MKSLELTETLLSSTSSFKITGIATEKPDPNI